MFSNTIYTLPYFYIIENKNTKIKYAGARWATGCHPSEFMTIGGYTTSSKMINEIIQQGGIDIFEILEIITIDELQMPFGTNSIFVYESWFLTFHNCASSNNWYNCHNNMGMAFGTNSFYSSSKQSCLRKYGVDNVFKSVDIQEKIKENHMNNLGVKHPMQSDLVKNKSKVSCKEKYGYEFTAQVPHIRKKQLQTRMMNNDGSYFSQKSLDKRTATSIKKYGVDNPMQSSNINQKVKKTKFAIYGDENYNNMQKNRQTKQEKYGDENYNNYAKNRKTCLEKYGVDNASKSDIVKKKICNTIMERHGVNYISEIILICPYCGKSGSKPPMTRWHFDNCKFKDL